MSSTKKSATVKVAWIGAASALAVALIGFIFPPSPPPAPIAPPGVNRPNESGDNTPKPDRDKLLANTIVTLEVTFFTTRDDKDDQDVVTTEVWKGGQILASKSEWAGIKLDNNSSHQMDIPMPANTQFDNDCELKVRKSGTDGWIFHVQVDGVFGDGRTVQILPRSGEIHFEDNPNSVASFPLRI